VENIGKILMADDEESFLKSTAVLLRRQGYECDCVSDAPGALAKLQEARYDLLIADIKMPGNNDLELIKTLPRIAPGLPVIMVTGYPSLESAAQSIELPVVAYMVKPVDFDQLLAQTQIAVEYSRTYRVVTGVPDHVQDWRVELGNVRRMISQTSGETFLPGIDAFVTQTFRLIVSHLADLKTIIENLALRNLEQQSTHTNASPWHLQVVDALFETLAVLEKEKKNSNTAELEALRLKLKKVVKGETVH
jgi:DNA-binding response OmpR family regulator